MTPIGKTPWAMSILNHSVKLYQLQRKLVLICRNGWSIWFVFSTCFFGSAEDFFFIHIFPLQQSGDWCDFRWKHHCVLPSLRWRSLWTNPGELYSAQMMMWPQSGSLFWLFILAVVWQFKALTNWKLLKKMLIFSWCSMCQALNAIFWTLNLLCFSPTCYQC
jgi:hypothetical protein